MAVLAMHSYKLKQIPIPLPILVLSCELVLTCSLKILLLQVYVTHCTRHFGPSTYICPRRLKCRQVESLHPQVQLYWREK